RVRALRDRAARDEGDRRGRRLPAPDGVLAAPRGAKARDGDDRAARGRCAMSDEPRRLLDDPGVSDALRAALEAGRELPTDAELASLAARLGPLLGPGGGGGAAAAASGASAAVKGAAGLLAAAAAVAGIVSWSA